jgi:small ligand-binding sensory domain FIST
MTAGTGLVTGKRADEAATEAARTSIARSGLAGADLALVFVTADTYPHVGEVLERVRRVTGARHVLGCSGAGVLTESGEAEAGPAVAVMVLGGQDRRELTPFVVSDRDMLDGDAGAEIRARVGPDVHDRGALIVLPDPVTLEPGQFLLGFGARLDPAPIFGGLAGGTPAFELAEGAVLHGGLAGFALAERPPFGIAQSCEPIGEPWVITEAVGNTVKAIAGRRPLEVLRDALHAVPDYEQRVGRFGVFAGLAVDPAKSPLERGDFLIRVLAGADQDLGAISLTEPASAGQTIQFQLRDPEAARADLESMLTRLAAELGGRAPAFGLYFNCAGRGAQLYGEPNHDVHRIRERLGEWPLIGFFGNGELAPVGTENLFHSYTGVLVVFPKAG